MASKKKKTIFGWDILKKVFSNPGVQKKKKSTAKKTVATKKTSTKKSSKKATSKSSIKKTNSKTTAKKKSAPKKTTKKKRATIVSRGTKKLSVNKADTNPIITPRPEIEWESSQAFNPAAVLIDDKVHFLYRAIGADGVSRFGYAVSSDGFTIDDREDNPVYEHACVRSVYSVYSYFSGGSWGGAEDPRIVRVENGDKLYVTYTACDGGLRVGLTSIGVEDFVNKKWKKWKMPKLISPAGEVHKNWVIFPEKIKGKYAVLHSINPDISIEYLDNLDFKNMECIHSQYGGGKKRKNCWDHWVRGAGAPPIRTPHGWLLFYHAMPADDFSKYRVGAMLLDLEDPTKVLARANKPIMSPDENYENDGFKSGVVYVSGVVVKDGELLIYYGGADSVVCVAHADFDKFVEDLRTHQTPHLSSRKLIKNKNKK